MTGVKIVDRNTRAPHRRARLWECFGKVKINPSDIKDAKGAYYAIIQLNSVERLLTDEVKQVFHDEGFDVLTPIEYSSLRSIVIRHIDKVINEYTEQEVIQSIEDGNEWAEVEAIVKLTTTGRLLKVRFKSTNMVATALEGGIVVLNQFIPAKNIERETYVRLVPCYNCFSYQHKTRDCDQDQQALCAYCAQNGHKQSQCKAQSPKCINCGGAHRTLASICEVRKKLIKEKSKEMRERSRSRSKQRSQDPRQGTSYADAAKINVDPTGISQTDMKDMIQRIVVSIVYAQCCNAIEPGTFQRHIDEMFKLNKIPNVKFPAHSVNNNLRSMYNDMMGQKTREQEPNEPRTREQDSAAQEEEEGEIPTTHESPIRRTVSISDNIHFYQSEQENVEMDTRDPRKRPRHPTTPDQNTDQNKKPKSKKQEREKEGERERPQPSTSTGARARIQSDPKRSYMPWIQIYVRKSLNISTDCSTEERRKRLRKIMMETEMKFHWKIKDMTYEQLHNALTSGGIKLETKMFSHVDDKTFYKLRNTPIDTCTP